MLRRLDNELFKILIKTGYGSAILAEPMLDAASPEPYIRGLAAGSEATFIEYMLHSSSYQGATAAYMKHVNAAILLKLDGPYSPALLPYVNLDSYSIVVSTDHLAWSVALKFTCQTLTFQACTLAQFLGFARAQSGRITFNVYQNGLEAHEAKLIKRKWWYTSDGLLAEARKLGAAAFEGPWRCNVRHGDVDSHLWSQV